MRAFFSLLLILAAVPIRSAAAWNEDISLTDHALDRFHAEYINQYGLALTGQVAVNALTQEQADAALVLLEGSVAVCKGIGCPGCRVKAGGGSSVAKTVQHGVNSSKVSNKGASDDLVAICPGGVCTIVMNQE